MEQVIAPDPDLALLPPTLRALASRGVLRAYRKGTLLIEEGEQGDSLYLIVSGRLRAYGGDGRGREITYGVYGPGEYVGELSLDGGPRSASVITEEASRCVMLTRASLLTHMAMHPDFALEILTKVIQRTRAATQAIKQLALNDVYGRLKALLDSGEPERGPRLTHQAMAQRLGCSREMVSRLLKDLETGGYLERLTAGRYRILKPLPSRW
ncbi:Crp/Fnr family transcriptional regulator [Pelomonas sp. SE-A7]|uniref:Crp/Fnr family transcriptional regulator n=1 Tax=Pelomonas sp. SE-A7 TaxID=3054953 RepID=UPI00259CC54B|nr:Crp/Fnr family transcriptional regulator [Pelomonas sp. SE-A7]MDM4767098.1 Crp/Fnr family transcriptional regulator [Pelomonas sp. SE-A7]